MNTDGTRPIIRQQAAIVAEACGEDAAANYIADALERAYQDLRRDVEDYVRVSPNATLEDICTAMERRGHPERDVSAPLVRDILTPRVK